MSFVSEYHLGPCFCFFIIWNQYLLSNENLCVSLAFVFRWITSLELFLPIENQVPYLMLFWLGIQTSRVLTLALSRCRCIVRSTLEEHAQQDWDIRTLSWFFEFPLTLPRLYLGRATTIIRHIYVLEAFDIYIYFCLHVDCLASSAETAYHCKTSIELL